jgi:hypothetical protein
MTKMKHMVFALALFLLSTQIMAQQSQIICEKSTDVEWITRKINANLEKIGDGYTASIPSATMNEYSLVTICVTVTKNGNA